MTDREPTTAVAGGVTARYYETDAERVLAFEREDDDGSRRGGEEGERRGEDDGARSAAVAQNREGYAMLAVRRTADGDELERYYGFEMALDHVAERLGVEPGDLPVPDPAGDMGM